ncbi:MAG TPA: MFS transporter [Victivallales bacterium]|nr:MFS transporter [Victivallales bacterium]
MDNLKKLNIKEPNILAMLFVFSMPNTVIASLTPGLIQLGKYFNISSSAMLCYVTTLAVLGYAIGPIIAPVIANCYGRKGAIFTGMLLIITGALGNIIFSIWLTDYSLFLIFRVISGLGAGIAITAVPAMIHDYYDEVNAKKKLFTVSGIYCLWPGFILIFCSFLSYYLGWECIMTFLLLYGLLGLAACYVLPETDPNRSSGGNALGLYIKSCFNLLTNFEFMLYSMIGALSIISMYFFISEAPFIIINKLHYPSNEYGYFAMLPYIASFFTLILGNIFAEMLTYRKCLLICLVDILFFSFLMLYLFLAGMIDILSFVGLSTLIIMAFSVLMGYSMNNAIKASSNKVAASGLYLFILMLLSSIVPDIAENFNSIGYLIYPLVLVVLGILYLGLISVYFIYIRKKNSISNITAVLTCE